MHVRSGVRVGDDGGLTPVVEGVQKHAFCLREIMHLRMAWVFPWHSHKNTNHVFRLSNPVYDIDMSIFKVTVFMKQARHE